MKYALNANGELVPATADAPAEGTCPACGEVVTLRTHKRMNGQTPSYYWRHRKAPPYCPHKSRPTFARSLRP